MSQEFAPGVLRHKDAYAKVTKEGRWRWGISLMVPCGEGRRAACVDFCISMSRSGAKLEAQRMIRQYVKKYTTPVESFEVHQGDEW